MVLNIIILVLTLNAKGVSSLDIRPQGYDPHKQPRGEDDGPVRVSLSMRINAINEVDERAMKVVLDVYFRCAWHDSRLEVPPELFNDSETDVKVVSQDFLLDHDLWLPDPYIERVHEIKTVSLLQPFSGVRVYRDGTIFWSQMFIVTLGCPMFFQYFPFDTQSCRVEISSYFYGSSDMAFDWEGDGVTASDKIPEVLNNYEFTFVQDNITECHTPGFVNGDYPCLKSSMTFTRRYMNFLMGVYVPSLLFVVVAWASFFWPADAIPGRTVLLITALLTTISLYSGVQHITPPANYTRAIDTWFFACVLAVATALFQYAVILQLRLRQEMSGVHKVKPISQGIDTMEMHNALKTREFWQRAEQRVENGARIFYWVIFILFNIPYWSSYLP